MAITKKDVALIVAEAMRAMETKDEKIVRALQNKKGTKAVAKGSVEKSLAEKLESYIKFCNRKKNAQSITSIEHQEDVTVKGKYPGFTALISYKDGSAEEATFLYRGGFVSKFKEYKKKV